MGVGVGVLLVVRVASYGCGSVGCVVDVFEAYFLVGFPVGFLTLP